MWDNGIASAVLFSCLLISASVWDIRKRIIPDTICVAIAAVGLLTFHPTKLLGVLIGLPFLIAALVKEGGMGGGDVKLVATSGFVLGFPLTCVGTIMGLLTLLLWHITMRAVCKVKRTPVTSLTQTALSLAPFLAIGFIGAMFLELGDYLQP